MIATLHNPPLLSPSSAVKSSVDFKANGEVSRMRAHKGNMPSLPQTKYCSLCPAKFTRTTHLNRHLRSHTNERLHHCDTCSSQFTRSDLLTRHKRTCGDPMNANRSRRKSCQSCAESKIKCDLQYPCSKCSARGRQCVFINNPEMSRIRKLAASQKSLPQQDDLKSAGSSPLDNLSSLPFLNSAFSSPALSFSSTSSSSLEFPMTGASLPIAINQQHNVPADFSNFDFAKSSGSSSPISPFEFLNSALSSTSSSCNGSPGSDIFERYTDFKYPLDFEVDPTGNPQLAKSSLDNALDPSFVDIFTSSLENPAMPFPSWTDGSDGILVHESLTYPQSYDGLTTLPSSTTFEPSTLNVTSSTLLTSFSPTMENYPPNLAYPLSAPLEISMIGNSKASPAELQHYLFLFFSAFSKQLPLIHPATWHQEGKPLVLIRAMQACGALFVNSHSALAFIEETLTSTREALVQIVARNSMDLTEQKHIILALVLLQTIGLFHRQKSHDGPASPTVYHGMLVTMIRRSALAYHVASWTPADLSDLSSLNSTWQDWASHETTKRALLLSYLHDGYHCMYSSTPSSFQSSEFKVHLPCDDTLWNASSFSEWFEALYSPSPFGNGTARLMGVDMASALASFGQMRLPTIPVSQNPFAIFLLIRSFLESSFTPCTTQGSLGLSPTRMSSTIGSSESEKTLPAQYALYNWLQAWLACPDHTPYARQINIDGAPFVLNALPFHWLQQVSLLARHANGLVSGPENEAPDCTATLLMSCWLGQVRIALSKGEPISAQLWEEFAKIRKHIEQSNADCKSIDRDSLLVFLPDDRFGLVWSI